MSLKFKGELIKTLCPPNDSSLINCRTYFPLSICYKLVCTNLTPNRYLREPLLWLRLSILINASDCEETSLKYNTKFNAEFPLACRETQGCFKLSIAVNGYTF